MKILKNMKNQILGGIVILTNVIMYTKFVPFSAIFIAFIINVICLCLAKINFKEREDNE